MPRPTPNFTLFDLLRRLWFSTLLIFLSSPPWAVTVDALSSPPTAHKLPRQQQQREDCQGHLRFFLDTADTSVWKELMPTGIFYGITTNPTLLERAQQPCNVAHLHSMASTAFDLGALEFMCQTWGRSVDELVATAVKLLQHPDAGAISKMVVKIPVTQDGVQAATQLLDHVPDARICFTGGYSYRQALLAVAVGVEYIAPYLGRMTDNGKNGYEECLSMQGIVDGASSDTRILVASIRDPNVIADLAQEGNMDTFTFSPEVARQLLYDEMTTMATGDFQEAAERNQ